MTYAKQSRSKYSLSSPDSAIEKTERESRAREFSIIAFLNLGCTEYSVLHRQPPFMEYVSCSFWIRHQPISFEFSSHSTYAGTKTNLRYTLHYVPRGYGYFTTYHGVGWLSREGPYPRTTSYWRVCVRKHEYAIAYSVRP